jgi:hypothetical protein
VTPAYAWMRAIATVHKDRCTEWLRVRIPAAGPPEDTPAIAESEDLLVSVASTQVGLGQPVRGSIVGRFARPSDVVVQLCALTTLFQAGARVDRRVWTTEVVHVLPGGAPTPFEIVVPADAPASFKSDSHAFDWVLAVGVRVPWFRFRPKTLVKLAVLDVDAAHGPPAHRTSTAEAAIAAFAERADWQRTDDHPLPITKEVAGATLAIAPM